MPAPQQDPGDDLQQTDDQEPREKRNGGGNPAALERALAVRGEAEGAGERPTAEDVCDGWRAEHAESDPVDLQQDRRDAER
jgi:hypothetical protein